MDWEGEKALVPVSTCYKILDIYLTSAAALSILALVMVYVREPVYLKRNPLYWIGSAMALLQLAAAVFRGWAFRVRYGALCGSLLVFALCTTLAIGLTPNWTFMILLLLSATVLFFGMRSGMIWLAAICVTHGVVAWAWVRGYAPLFVPDRAVASIYLDYSNPLVWIRVLLVSAGFLAALIMLMRYVLHDLREALRQSNSTLLQLGVEQEYRARAEEARLTAERNAREAQKFDALGRLAGGVAHDINNSLCVVKCWQSVLATESPDPLVREAMSAIGVAADNASQLTQHLLAFSRRDATQTETVDLAAAVTREAITLARMLPKDIAVSTETGGPTFVRLGRGQLQEIVLNLAINARDAMPQGGKLVLRVRRTPGTGPNGPGIAILEVEDTGVGMDESVRMRIFEPFFTTKENGKGTGLGLAMVYGIVTGAGGTIDVRSELGRGTSFALRLPETVPVEPAVVALPAQPTTEVRCRVLVADDNPEIRSLMARILERDGFKVILAEDGDRASAALTGGGELGLMIVDGVMPGLATTELVRLAETHHPGCRVILSSGYKKSELVRRGLEAGRYVLLPKPFVVDQLRRAIASALGSAPASQAAAATSQEFRSD